MRVTWFVAFMTACVTIGIVDSAWGQASDRGRDEYLRFCEPCHGATGKGDGPTAKQLAKRPADLTRLSEANGGVFPLVRVFDVIDGRLDVELHGPREMPVWADRHKQMADELARRRILQVIEYISTLQGK